MGNWFVEVVAYSTLGECAMKRIGPCSSERDAEKVDRGVNINLNHERFYTRIVQDKADPKVSI
jgi:hypothetical protein